MDFAFFAVNFGYSKADYESLTLTEKAFIRKAYEDKAVMSTSLLNKAVANAVSNVMRKKGKRPIKLWKKRRSTIVDKTIMQNTIKGVIENERRCGKSWIKKIYRAASFELEAKGGGNIG